MVQVLETMREIGVDPVLSSATAALFERSGSLGLAEAFPEKPASPEAVIEFMERRLGKRA
jgi:UDP-glucose 4-epimerase